VLPLASVTLPRSAAYFSVESTRTWIDYGYHVSLIGRSTRLFSDYGTSLTTFDSSFKLVYLELAGNADVLLTCQFIRRASARAAVTHND
jgi:hypothetical protein